MKSILLLFFLIVLAYSKLPEESFKSLLEYDNGDDDEMGNPCLDVKNKNDCLATSVSNGKSQCCYNTKTINKEQAVEICELSPKPLKDFSTIIKAKQFKPLIREVYGYIGYGFPDKKMSPIEYENEINNKMNCGDGNLEYTTGGEKYSDDDIKILSSGDHCLNYTISSIFYREQKDLDCKKGKLLKSSKDAGIECGKVVLKIKNEASEDKIQTCVPFSYDMFSKMTIPAIYQDTIKGMAQNLFGSTDIFTVELSDSKGRKVRYDSVTGEITSNNNSILTISKYLFLLSLFLF